VARLLRFRGYVYYTQRDQRETLAALLCAMYWRGCRHPLALGTAQLHPPTALVRWLSRFTVQQQVDHGRQILDALVAEKVRVHRSSTPTALSP